MINYLDNFASERNLSPDLPNLVSQREVVLGENKLWLTTELTLSLDISGKPLIFFDVIFYDKKDGNEVASFGLTLRPRGFSYLTYPELLTEAYDYIIDGNISYNYKNGFEVNPWISSIVLKERIEAVSQLIEYLSDINILKEGTKVCSLVYADSSSAKSEKRKKLGIIDTGDWTIRMMERFNRDNKEKSYRRIARSVIFIKIFQV